MVSGDKSYKGCNIPVTSLGGHIGQGRVDISAAVGVSIFKGTVEEDFGTKNSVKFFFEINFDFTVSFNFLLSFRTLSPLSGTMNLATGLQIS
jgi:hypothetical protein